MSPVYAVTPHGQAFEAGSSFSIPLSAAEVPAGAVPMLLKAEPGGKWRVMGNTSTDPARLAADIYDLSYFVIGFCSSTPNDRWTIGGVDCPTAHRLELTLWDGNNVRIERGNSAIPDPWMTITDTPRTLNMRLDWLRPAGIVRTDQLSVVGLRGGFRTGFTSTWPSPAVLNVSDSHRGHFSVTIDPAQVAGASEPNGRVLRIKAYASYTTTAFRVGVGNIPVGFEFETTDIPILVRYSGGALPAITQQPANAGVTVGQPASFSVAASGTGLTYQWSRRANAGATFAAIAGATTASHAIAATQLADDGAQFQVQVCAAPTRCVTSNIATLTVTQAAVAPVFSTQPADLSVVAGQTASFSVVATGVPLPQLRWQSVSANGRVFRDVVGVPACGVTSPPASGSIVSATCTVGPMLLADSGTLYRAVAVNSADPDGVASGFATVTITAAPTAPSITQQPASQTTTVGGSATFSVGATGTASLGYVWRLGNNNLPSVSGGFNTGTCIGSVTYSNGGATITVSDLTAGCNGVAVSVVVSNNINPSATSNGATLTVTAVTQSLSLLAGAFGGPGTIDGPASEARVGLGPDNGLAFDASGNAYFSDSLSGRVRKATPAGVVSTIAGAGTPLRAPLGVAVDSAGNVFVVERANHRILRITPAGVQSVWAGGGPGDQDGTGTAARFTNPAYLAIDAGDNLYVGGLPGGGMTKIRRISPAQVVTTFHDFGSSGEYVLAMAVAGAGSVVGAGGGTLFGTVVRITPSGVVSTLAGVPGQGEDYADGTGAAARFRNINGLTIDASGDFFATDGNARAIRRITPAGVVTTVSGGPSFTVADGPPTVAGYEYPSVIAWAPSGFLMIGDVSTLRRLEPLSGFVASTFVGRRHPPQGSNDGTGSAARFAGPGDVALDAAGDAYIADGSRVRRVTPAGVVTTLAATPARMLVVDPNGGLVVANNFALWRVTTAGVATLLAGDPMEQAHVDGTGSAARFFQISALAVDAAGNLFVAESNSHTIRRITPAGVVSTIAGAVNESGSVDGTGAAARFNRPMGLAVDTAGNLFVADAGQATLRRITPAGVVSTVAGGVLGSVDGVGAAARFYQLGKLAFDSGGRLLIADGSTLRRMTPAGAVTTVLGVPGEIGVVLGASPRIQYVNGMAVRPNGRVVLTSEAAVLEATVP